MRYLFLARPAREGRGKGGKGVVRPATPKRPIQQRVA
jgi:hypothetical protein